MVPFANRRPSPPLPCLSSFQNLDYSLVECQALVLAPTRELAQQIEKVGGRGAGLQGKRCSSSSSSNAHRNMFYPSDFESTSATKQAPRGSNLKLSLLLLLCVWLCRSCVPWATT